MRRFLLLLLIAPALSAQVSLTGGTKVTGPATIPKGGAAAPSVIQGANGGINFSNPMTLTFGSSVTAGDNIFVIASVGDNTSTFTFTDNCNTGGSSDTYTTDGGPTNEGSGRAAMAHAKAGTTGTCTVSVAWSGAASFGIISMATFSGSGTLDVASSTLNGQSAPGSGILSPSVTTTGANRLCLVGTVDAGFNSGNITAGTGWTLATATGTVGNAVESKVQASSGSIQGTASNSQAFSSQLTGISCFAP